LSSSLNLPFALLAGVILLPLIPAFIIFKLLPASADVSGPLQGFEIKLGGAFGAYFALVVLILFTKNAIWDPPPPVYQVWTVTGTINDNGGSSISPLGEGDISLLPPSLSEQSGWFTIDIPVKPGQGGVADYPTLSISHPGYQSVYVNLNPASAPPTGVRFDAAAHTVNVTGLRLQPLPAYTPAAPLNPGTPPAAAHPQTAPAGGQS
jgi:hypothetical protein